jgi:hypothetical protein
LEFGIQNLLKSKNITDAFKKYGNLDPTQLQEAFKWGSGTEVRIVDAPGNDAAAKGWTADKGSHVEISSKLIAMLESASPEDRDAALLVVIATLLHEQTHVGDIKAGRIYEGHSGADLVDEIYSLLVKDCNCKVPDIDFLEGMINSQWREKNITGGKAIIKNKKDRNEEKDVPSITWGEFDAWLEQSLKSNPKIKVH